MIKIRTPAICIAVGGEPIVMFRQDIPQKENGESKISRSLLAWEELEPFYSGGLFQVSTTLNAQHLEAS